jgi:hypothetical protein
MGEWVGGLKGWLKHHCRLPPFDIAPPDIGKREREQQHSPTGRRCSPGRRQDCRSGRRRPPAQAPPTAEPVGGMRARAPVGLRPGRWELRAGRAGGRVNACTHATLHAPREASKRAHARAPTTQAHAQTTATQSRRLANGNRANKRNTCIISITQARKAHGHAHHRAAPHHFRTALHSRS